MYDFESINNQRILLSFLNWGKGHLSRSIDVCRRLAGQNNTLLVACSIDDFLILKAYVPGVEHISFQNYPFHFSGTGDFTSDLLKSRKSLTDFVAWEQQEVEKLVASHQVSLIVSDHRYGFYSKKTPSVFITHQVQLALKWWQFPAQSLHKKWMKKFNFTWIMDDEQHPLAGKLSRKGNLENASYIGHFSRFESNSTVEKTIELGVCNGPHPYNRQLLEKLIQNTDLDFILSEIPHEDRRVISPENWQETDELFYKAKVIHSYCGYSTLMDLKRLKCTGNLVPTPGQAEQEYLYRSHLQFDFT